MKVKIKSFDIFSAFKIGAILSALMFLVAGIPMILLQSAVLGAAMFYDPNLQSEIDPGMFASLGIVGACLGIGVFAVMYALFGGIGAAIAAFVYNLTSGWVGGLEVDLERVKAESDEKQKRSGVDVEDI